MIVVTGVIELHPEDVWPAATAAAEMVRHTEQEAERTARAKDLGDSVYDAYQKRQQTYLAEILDRINGRVAELYEALHPGEGLSEVCVEPWTAKGVELAINASWGRGRFKLRLQVEPAG